MIIKSLQLNNYRNYNNLIINFSKSTNLIYGDNAQGKTNILEAIYMAATAKSHRTNKDRDVVSFGKDESHIKLILEKHDFEYRIDIHLKKNKAKGIAVNSLPIKKISELYGILNVVFFSPEDLGIIKQGPSQRRRFIDMELCQLSKIYVDNLIAYNRVLAQRNKLLKEISYNQDLVETLDVWDEQLIRYGSEIINYRYKFIKDLADIMGDIHLSLTDNVEKIVISYDKSVDIDNFRKNLRKYRDKDIRQKQTNIGPHRDDIGFFLKNTNNMDLRVFGSQGQQRTAALSLKLAEIEIVKLKTKDYPVLLLDDVLSELDCHRQNRLLKYIEHLQTIITCTGVEDVINKSIDIDKIMQVSKARVYQCQSNQNKGE